MLYRVMATILRSLIAYIILLILGRLVGRKMISRITFFDFIVGVTLGSLAVRISLGNEKSVLLGIVSAVTITMLVLITDWLNVKSCLFRKIEEGEPVVLIRRGKLLARNVAKAKMSLSKVLTLLRQKDVFDIADVDYAIIENDGQLSVLLKPDKQPATAGDLHLVKPENNPPVDIIVDGKVILKNLESSRHDEVWLRQQLQARGIDKPEQVFYASVDKNGKLFLSAFHEDPRS